MERRINNVLEDIKRIIFHSKVLQKRSERHKAVQNKLVSYFQENDFNVEKEFYLAYRTLRNRNKKFAPNRVVFRNGYIDIFAKKDRLEVAIEFDTGFTVK